MRFFTRPVLGILLILINFLVRLENAFRGRFPKEIDSSIDAMSEKTEDKEEKIDER